jgi:hypothetical protein
VISASHKPGLYNEAWTVVKIRLSAGKILDVEFQGR